MHRVDCEGVLHMLVTVQMFWSTSPTCSRSPRPALNSCGHLTCFSWSRTFGSTNQSQYVSNWIRNLKYMRWLKKRVDDLWWSSTGFYSNKTSCFLSICRSWCCDGVFITETHHLTGISNPSLHLLVLRGKVLPPGWETCSISCFSSERGGERQERREGREQRGTECEEETHTEQEKEREGSGAAWRTTSGFDYSDGEVQARRGDRAAFIFGTFGDSVIDLYFSPPSFELPPCNRLI